VDIFLREGRREDFETLWRMDQACFPPGIAYSRLELALYMRRRGSFTLVAESSSAIKKPDVREEKFKLTRPGPPTEIVGFIVAEADHGGTGHIITIDVVPKARRSGAGSRLLTAAEDRLRSAPCHSVYLETAVDNEAAIAFYKRHGYVMEKTVPHYYSNGADAFVLSKKL
jgi:ribosomal-protein-alanine N-acetyltransferase